MAAQPPYIGSGATPPPASPSAVTALVLGLVGLAACGLLTGIPAMIVARGAIREIDGSEGRLGGRGLATAGFWTGLVGTVWSVVVLVALVVTVVIGISLFGDVWDAFCGSEIGQDC